MVLVADAGGEAVGEGKMPELVVRVREWPN